jgi:hypothetical protein
MGTVVGPKVGSELDSLTGGKVAIQGVDYPASAAVRTSSTFHTMKRTKL